MNGIPPLRYLSRTIGRRILSVACVCVPVPLSSVIIRALFRETNDNQFFPFVPNYLCSFANPEPGAFGYLYPMSEAESFDLNDRFGHYEESRAGSRVDSGAYRHLTNDRRDWQTKLNPASISQYSFSTQDDETYVNPLRDFTRCPSDSYNIRLLIINNYVYESLMTWCYSV